MYCTVDDIKSALTERTLLQLVDDDNEGGLVAGPPSNAAYQRCLDAIDAADTMIDGYVGGRYTLPFPSVPKLVTQISINLAICTLYERKRESDLPEAILSRRNSFIKTLEKIQRGEVVLGIGNTVQKVEPDEYIVDRSDAEREFPDSLLDMY